MPWHFTKNLIGKKTDERAAKSVWDVLRYRTLKKTAFDFFGNVVSVICIVCNCFDEFRTNLPKNIRRSHRKENTNFPKWRWVRSKIVCLSSSLLFFLLVTKKYVLRTSWDVCTWISTCFCSNAESRSGCASSRWLRLVLWLFTSCVWDVLGYRTLIKTAFVSWAMQKLPKRRWVRSRNVFFELCSAWFFGCK